MKIYTNGSIRAPLTLHHVKRAMFSTCLVKLTKRKFDHTNNIDTSRLEFTKRNELIVHDLNRFYPSMSDLQSRNPDMTAESISDQDHDNYKQITVKKFLDTFEKNPQRLNGEDDYKSFLQLNGRIKNIRYSGKKIAFIDLFDSRYNVKIQVILNLNKLKQETSEERFQEVVQLLKKGDYIKAFGIPGFSESRSHTLSLKGTKLPVLLSAAQYPLPSQLKDELKARKNRVLDYQVNGVSSLLLRSNIIRLLRSFLDKQEFIEVETPILSSKSNGANARPFITKSGSLNENLELRIAPELWLKRLIISGLDRVYEIGKVFRNEGVDSTHNPEFTLLEFYERYLSMTDLIEKSEDLFKHILVNLELKKSEYHFSPAFDNLYRTLEQANWKFRRIEFLPTLSQELNIDFSLIDLNDAEKLLESLPAHSRKELFENVPPGELSSQQILNKLCSFYLESRYCDTIHPTIIFHHPRIISPLAKAHPSNQQITKRFEMFINGKEYINAYEEENCPQLQEKNFQLQQFSKETIKNKENDELISPDEGFINAMKSGMPPVGGFGLGVDRLCMLLMNKGRIEDVLPFGCVDDVKTQ